MKNSTNSSSSNLDGKIAYYNQEYKNNERVDIHKAQIYIDSIKYFASLNNYEKGLAIASLNQGLLENVKGNFNLAITNNEKALKFFNSTKNDSLIAITIASLGVSYWQKGENDKALSYLFKAIHINDSLQNKNELAATYNRVSMVYQSQGKISLAEEFADKSMSIINNAEPALSHIYTFHNLANLYGMQAKYKDALALDSIGLNYCEQFNVQFNKSMFYDNMANCFYFNKEYNKSIEYHFKAIAIDSTFQNEKQLGDSYCNLGALYQDQNNYQQAILYYKKSIEFCKNAGYKVGLNNALVQLSNLYNTTNNSKEAFQLLNESITVKDSIINQSSEQKIAELQTLFDTEKKKQQIIQQELKISRRNILLAVLFSIFLVSLIIFYFIYNRNKLKQEQKLQQELLNEAAKRSKAILESEENERQRLARELHDGVGQLLSASKLNLTALSSNNCTLEEKNRLQNSMDILDESIKEIRNISHNMVPDVLVKYGLKSAIENFISRINQTKKIDINFECNNFNENSLDDTSKLMLYRIIQESVNNTMKYAEATAISILLSADENEISLLIEDNGKGFDVEEAKQKGGIGIKNIELRTEYLKGRLEIESSSQNGTTIIVEIPLS